MMYRWYAENQKQPHTAILSQKVWWRLYLLEVYNGTGTLVVPTWTSSPVLHGDFIRQ